MALPRSTVVTLGGKGYHTEWLGDADPFVEAYRYGLIGPKPADDTSIYYSQPTGSVEIRELTTALVDGGWSFFSAAAIDYDADFGPTRSDFLVPPPTSTDGFISFRPYRQHAVLCDMTDTHRTGGGLALYGIDEYATTADDVAAVVGGTSNDVIVLVIDGSGSYLDFANEQIAAFLDAFAVARPGNSTRLVVTMFSDYPVLALDSAYGGESTDVPAYRVGTWSGIDGSTSASVIATLPTLPGRGGDNNESQFEGIWAGMRSGGLATGPGGTAEGCTGDKAIVVYTDAASSIGWSSTALFPLRRWPPNGNGGSGPTRHWPRSPGRRGAY